MNSGKRKRVLKEAYLRDAGRQLAKQLTSEHSSRGIDPDVLSEFGITAEDAEKIRSRKDLIRAIGSKMVESHGEVVHEELLANIELMIDTDPALRDFIDRSFID